MDLRLVQDATATRSTCMQPLPSFSTPAEDQTQRIGIEFLRQALSDEQKLSPAIVRVIRAFLQKVDHLRHPVGKVKSGFEHEYLQICWSIDHAPWYEDALTPQTKATKLKNRYRDVIPFEKTRVRLENTKKVPGGDYINANFIDCDYIACCAPVPAAICDFWHMVWQCDVHVILMLTNFVERERTKADVYWDTRGKAVDFNGIYVQVLSEAVHPASHGFIMRRFKVWKMGNGGTEAQSRVIQHVQLTTWPDHGVLRDFRVIAPMLELVNSHKDIASQTLGVNARVIVHCSAGIGRSGTFIAIDIILKELVQVLQMPSTDDDAIARKLECALDVQSIVHRIRSQRPGMVQTPEQYEMIYKYLVAVLSNSQPW